MYSPASNPTIDSNSQQTCPHCGVKVPASAFVCPNCNKNLLQELDTSFNEYADFDKPPMMRTLLTAASLGLLLFLAGITLMDLDTLFGSTELALYAPYLFLAVSVIFLAIFAARGRRPHPSPLNYLVAFVIVIIPVVGWLYGLFYTGRVFANRRMSRALIFVLLMVVTTAAFLHYGGTNIVAETMARFNIGSLAGDQVAFTTETPQATATKPATMTVAPIPTIVSTEAFPEGTPDVESTAAQAMAPKIANCILWSDITLDDVDKNLCVYGEYIRTFKKDENTWVMVFGEQPGAFQIWSYPKDIAEYLPDGGSTCVMTSGWIKTTGIRPFIELRIFDELLPCPQ